MIKFNYLLFVLLFVFFYSCEKQADEIQKTSNGYKVTIGTGEDQITVVVVNGTPFEMGKALGQLLKNDVNDCLTGFLDYGRNGAPDRFNNQNLDAAWESVSAFTDDRFKEELKGLAEGSGLPLIELRRAHMIPVLGDYACSGVAVWGD